ncbi:hypothetical protein Dole_2708 [Desulfosudis oleivorans Hxd3]|uniref:Uncharacterized protein n=1 Tax=Desulfosudis oleivorans (strain DSM 6200 / JCM 39069 / Hxd3) TaxID=96561 RepID=A8ZXD2_DESOH|nr:hypothetical protein Dole_2708 [Desulfosudis oleivorans Hxd3]
MTKAEKEKYESIDALKDLFKQLKGRKFVLDCGHHVTFGYFLSNNIVIINEKEPKIICTDCWD